MLKIPTTQIFRLVRWIGRLHIEVHSYTYITWPAILFAILYNKMCMDLVSTRTKSNLPFTKSRLLAQYTIIFHCVPCSENKGLIFVAAYLRPCVSLERRFGWSWLSWNSVRRAGWATKDYPMSFIFSLECREHKEGQMKP